MVLNNSAFKLCTFTALSSADLYQIMQLRCAVFVLEQNCAYQDLDGLDQQALHLYKKAENNEIVAYARILTPQQGEDTHSSIGRVVVKQNQRHANIGHALMQTAINTALKQFPKHPIKISAQSYLYNFYQQLGFVNSGRFYLEDQIPHQEMVYQTEPEL